MLFHFAGSCHRTCFVTYRSKIASSGRLATFKSSMNMCVSYKPWTVEDIFNPLINQLQMLVNSYK